MDRNTATTFAELRFGDRFYLAGDKQKVAYQVVGKWSNGTGSYNQVENGKKRMMHDVRCTADRAVVFLRHTRPAPGEEWPLNELKHNDVFHLTNNVINEFRIVQPPGYVAVIVGVNTDDVQEAISLPALAKVVFIRVHEEETKKVTGLYSL